jgi:general stress protein YciG
MTLIEFARMGGNARAESLTAKRRSEIARKAGIASGISRKLASKLKGCQSTGNSENKDK